MTKVGIVTVTYNSESVLGDFLDSLAGLVGDISVYAVDNASVDRSIEMMQAEGRVKNLQILAQDRNTGVAEGNNIGIEAALADGCDWVLFLNNDTVFPPQLVEQLLSDAAATGTKIITPVIEANDPAGTVWYSDGRYVEWQAFRPSHPGQGEPMSAAPTEIRKTQYSPTCCLLVAAEVFYKVGIMDPDYFVYFDDLDFAVRCNRGGYQTLVTPGVVLLHKASSLTGGPESPFALHWGSRNWTLIARKNQRGFRRLLSYAVIYVRSFLRFAIGKDDRVGYGVRLKAFREARTMPLNPLPFPRRTDESTGITSTR